MTHRQCNIETVPGVREAIGELECILANKNESY